MKALSKALFVILLLSCQGVWAKTPHILLIGAPGSGKGTLTQVLQDEASYQHICLGDLLRDEMRRASPLGQQIRQKVERGELIDNRVMFDLFEREFLRSLDSSSPIIVDGMVQSREHVTYFEELLSDLNLHGDFLYVYLNVPRSVAEDRLLHRAVCHHCNYSARLDESGEALCPRCETPLKAREDDQSSTIIKRLDRFYQRVLPLISSFEDKAEFVEIDATRSLDELKQHYRHLAHGY